VKILHITDGIPPITLGGTGRIVIDLAKAQADSGYETVILTALPANKKMTEPSGVKIFTIPAHSERWAHWRCVFSLVREREILGTIDSFKPEIIHAHTISRQCGYRWMSALKKRGIKLVVTCHDVSHIAYGKVTGREKNLFWRDLKRYRWSFNPFRNVLIKKFLKNADKILSVSDALKNYLARRGIQAGLTVHNGIDTDFWSPALSKAEARSKLNLPVDKFLFLFAGRLGYDKGSTLVKSSLPENAGLILAGGGYDQEFLPSRSFSFSDRTAGQMKSIYASCDAVLVPSRCLDCFPTVCLEAMSMRRPVLATSWGGARESVIDSKTGWIMDPLDETAWKSRMQWCVDNSDKLDAMGAAGRERMIANFDLKRMVDQLDEIYTNLLEHRGLKGRCCN